jgi:protein SCO1/2
MPAAVAASLWAASATAASYNLAALPDTFDPALLRIEEGRHLGQTVPDVRVQTETGGASLREIIAGQPAILVLAYYSCHGPCPTTIRNLSRTLRAVEASGHRVIVLSFDANDDLDSLRHVKSDLGDIPSSWTFGLMAKEDAQRLTQSVGFKYFFSEKDQAYIHPSVLVFLSPEGEVMRYLYGVEPRAGDVEIALLESGKRVQHLNDLVNMARLICSRYDPTRSRYVVHPTLIFGAAGLGLLGITGLLAFTYKRDSKGVPS